MHKCILAQNRNCAASDRPFRGQYKVVARSGRVMKILMKGKVETVSLDRVKPAHLECEPTTGTNTQRTTPNKQQSSKTTRISSGNPKDPLRPSSANTQTSNRTSVPQQLDDKVKLSNKDKTYSAAFASPAVSRANGNGAACERIHAYLYIYRVKPRVQLTP